MQLNYGQVKERSVTIAAAMSDARSARNLASRERARDLRDEREANHFRRRRKQKEAEELLERMRQQVRVRMPTEERPKVGASTARKLFHRTVEWALGTIGLTDARGPDGLCALHFSFLARGFASTTGRRWRTGEAERAALYIVRNDGLEGGESGWWSNIAVNRNELAAFYRTSEAIERHDRRNANVYCTEIIALPHELSARQRRKAVRRICRFFDKRGLAYTAAIHLPDLAGDQRNYHVHILYSLRPAMHHGAYDWSFALGKESDINTPRGIKARRIAVVRAINKTLVAARIDKRYTHLSNKARQMAEAQPKIGQQATWTARRLAALEKRAEELQRLAAIVRGLRTILIETAITLQRQRTIVRERLHDFRRKIDTLDSNRGMYEVDAAVRATIDRKAILAHTVVSARQARITEAGRRISRAISLDKFSGDVDDTIVAAGRSLQSRRAATDEHLDMLGGRVRRAFDESSGQRVRLTLLGRIAKGRARHARLVGQSAAIAEALAAFEASLSDIRHTAVSSMLAMRDMIDKRTRAGYVRLANLHRTGERLAAAGRLNAMAVDLNGINSNITRRLADIKQQTDLRLSGVGPIPLAPAQTRRLALLGEVAHQRHRGQQLSDAREIVQSRGDTVPTLPAASGEAQRGSDRRNAIAAAAWQLRRASFPPQVRTSSGFGVAPSFVHVYRAADLFEAEDVIQRIHAAKRAKMLAAVRRNVEGAERSPFIESEGASRLPTSIFDPALRQAADFAAKDRDLIDLIDQLVLVWRKREAEIQKARTEAQIRKEREATDRRDRMRPGVQKIYRAIQARNHDGRYPRAVMITITDDVTTVAKAIGHGKLAMRIVEGSRHFYCATEGLRNVVTSLTKQPVGREILFALGALSLDEAFEPSELSRHVVLNPKGKPQSSAETGVSADIFDAFVKSRNTRGR
ncbi:MAG: hypothetical protein EOP62_20720 [Sphingomonadales bacterium]|nr:MAG: hypothetical protein EOP62_20720 [Sphingomonadales bacterium]